MSKKCKTVMTKNRFDGKDEVAAAFRSAAALKARKKKARAAAMRDIETRNMMRQAAVEPYSATNPVKPGRMQKSHWIEICKAIASGRDLGVSDRQIYLTMRNIAAQDYKDLTEAKAFAKLLDTEDGKLMYKAAKRSPRKEALRTWDVDEEDALDENEVDLSEEPDELSGEADEHDLMSPRATYVKTMKEAEKTRKPGQSTASRFAEIYLEPAMVKFRNSMEAKQLRKMAYRG